MKTCINLVLFHLNIFLGCYLQAPPKMDILGELVIGRSDSSGGRSSNLGTADLVINGSVIETKLSIYGKVR